MTPSSYIIIALLIFFIGATGVVIRKNAIVIFMCIELMFNACNLILVTFAKSHGNIDAEVGVLFVMIVAAVEAAVGLAITLAFFRHQGTSQIDAMSELKG